MDAGGSIGMVGPPVQFGDDSLRISATAVRLGSLSSIDSRCDKLGGPNRRTLRHHPFRIVTKTRRSLHPLILLSLLSLLSSLTVARAQTFEWAAKGTGGKQVIAQAIAIDSSGNLYSVGYFANDIDMVAFGNLIPVAHASDDIYLVKYDSTGTPRWVRSVGGNGFDEAFGVCVDPRGNVCIAGIVNSSPLAFDSVTVRGVDSAIGLVAKYDSL